MNGQTKKVKFNLLDGIIVALLLLILLGVGGFLIYRQSHANGTVSVRYTILIKDVPNQMSIKINEGDTVVDTVKLNTLGTVHSYEILDCTYDTYDETTGQLHRGTYTDFRNLALTVDSEAQKSDEEYNVVGYKLSVGTLLYIRTPHFTGYGYVTDFAEISN